MFVMQVLLKPTSYHPLDLSNSPSKWKVLLTLVFILYGDMLQSTTCLHV